VATNTVNSFLNFLQHPSLVLGNKTLDSEGKATFIIPSGIYASVLLIATNNDEVIEEVVPLENHKFQTRDLS
jgi:hypothetical protein